MSYVKLKKNHFRKARVTEEGFKFPFWDSDTWLFTKCNCTNNNYYFIFHLWTRNPDIWLFHV